MQFDKELSKKPNKYAPSSSYTRQGELIHIRGYQNYTYNSKKGSLLLSRKDKKTRIKKRLVEKAFLLGRG